MGYLEFCSNCGKKNKLGFIDGNNRYYCINCKTIHYENPKPTVTLVCINKEKILLVKRAFDPGKGLWSLPGGFVEKQETPGAAAIRELKEETQLVGKIKTILNTCSHHNTVFGDILLIGYEMEINDWSTLKAGDDAAAAAFFDVNKTPKLAFYCHEIIFNFYKERAYNENSK